MDDRDPEFIRFKAQTRLGIVKALVRALDLGWPLIQAIEGCPDRAAARSRLVEAPFDFDEIQAEHILDLTLSRRTQLGRQHLQAEIAELEEVLRSTR